MGMGRKFATASVLLCAASSVCRGITISTVPVGNPGNPPDPDNGFGVVSYAYNIGTYDVTASQYCAFLNAVATTSDPYGIYHPNMAGTTSGNPGIVQTYSSGTYSYSVINGRGNYPVTDVDFWNATRFANWMDNGQPTTLGEGKSSTETGAYDLLDTQMDYDLFYNNPTQADKDNYENSQAVNDQVLRSSSASWAVTSQNEWYKAAYYSPLRDPSQGGGQFYQYPVQAANDTLTTSETNMGSNDTTPVGSYLDTPYSGTYDQGGNVYQWNETETNSAKVQNTRDERGGAFDNGNDLGRAASSESIDQQPWIAANDTGFRVVQLNTFSSGGLLDVSNKCLVLSNPPANGLANIISQIQSGFNNGGWNGSSGITSSTVAADPKHLTALGVMINDQSANSGASDGLAVYTSMDDNPTSDGDILVKYTYYGDANLSGTVDGSDYSLIDNGYLQHLSGWFNGDFNYDSVVNGSDFTLIDNSFNAQGTSLATEVARPTAKVTSQLAGGSPVPEPAELMVLGMAAGLLSRARRRKQ